MSLFISYKWMIFLNVSDIIVNNKYKQLFIFHQFDGVRTINIYGR